MFGIKVINVKELISLLKQPLQDSSVTTRDMAMACLIELRKWLGMSTTMMYGVV
jgi:hypothetical protein